MFVIINCHAYRINKSHLIDLYGGVSWAEPRIAKFASRLVAASTAKAQPVALPHHRLGGRSAAGQVDLQRSLFTNAPPG